MDRRMHGLVDGLMGGVAGTAAATGTGTTIVLTEGAGPISGRPVLCRWNTRNCACARGFGSYRNSPVVLGENVEIAQPATGHWQGL